MNSNQNQIRTQTKEDIMNKSQETSKTVKRSKDLDNLNRNLMKKVYAYEDVEKKGKADVDKVLKIYKEIEQQLEEPAEII